MTSEPLHPQSYHHPVNHNRRVKALIGKFWSRLLKAHGERQEILDREDEGEKLCFEDEYEASRLYLQMADLSRTVEQLHNLILPEES